MEKPSEETRTILALFRDLETKIRDLTIKVDELRKDMELEK